jgi:hypothetical protein
VCVEEHVNSRINILISRLIRNDYLNFFHIFLMPYPVSFFPLLEMSGQLSFRSLIVARGSTQLYMNRLHRKSLEKTEGEYKELQGYMLTAT